MAGGLFALLDDIAAFARIAAASVDDIGAAALKASSKAAGVVVDDTAVTPQYLVGAGAERELPVIWKIAKGSLRNKLILIIPVALLLSEFLPKALPVLLVLGGCFLAFEGAEKIWEKVGGHAHAPEEDLTPEGFTAAHEAATVRKATTTDLILSAEIMVISLKEIVSAEPAPGFLARAATLIVVAVFITALVYGVVALLVKMDDAGVALAAKARTEGGKAFGRGLVKAMPSVLTAIGVIGTAAMLWVGGHILLVSLDELGWHAPYGLVHDAEVAVAGATGALGGLMGWLTNTLLSAVVGVVVGAIIVAVLTALGLGHAKGGKSSHGSPATGAPKATGSRASRHDSSGAAVIDGGNSGGNSGGHWGGDSGGGGGGGE